jgi:hypothetical protein
MIHIPNNITPYLINKKDMNMVHIIRKKELKQADTYYTSVLQNKHYIYSFTNTETAKKCVQFLKHYRLKNNKYPDVYGNNGYEEIGHKQPILENDIYIDIDIISALKTRCIDNNIGLMAINEFDYIYLDFFLNQRNVFNLSISGVDLLEGEVVDYNKAF